MILYSKSGDFLGVGKDELSFLGYEDLDEFKNFNNDVADLFVNKPGYIFKFKSFSWIDYALHSGAPKKSAIVKLKNGNEVEVTLKIKELFLYESIKDSNMYYSVELISGVTLSPREPMLTQTASTTDPDKFALKEVEEYKEKELQEISFEEDFVEEKHEEAVVEADDEDEAKTNKIIFDEEDFLQDYDTKEPFKLKVDLSVENLPKEEIIEPVPEIQEDYSENIEISTKEEKVDFDLVLCVDNLGLDISLVGELITDFMFEIDTLAPTIKTAIEDKDEKVLTKNIYSLKGISDNLYTIQLSNKLSDILAAEDAELRHKKFEEFKKIAKKYKRELI